MPIAEQHMQAQSSNEIDDFNWNGQPVWRNLHKYMPKKFNFIHAIFASTKPLDHPYYIF